MGKFWSTKDSNAKLILDVISFDHHNNPVKLVAMIPKVFYLVVGQWNFKSWTEKSAFLNKWVNKLGAQLLSTLNNQAWEHTCWRTLLIKKMGPEAKEEKSWQGWLSFSVGRV